MALDVAESHGRGPGAVPSSGNPDQPSARELSLEEIFDRAVENGKRKVERWAKNKVKRALRAVGLGDSL
jgi:hypothetical protein